MFKVCMYEDMGFTAYSEFIRYAINKSDAVMMVTHRHGNFEKRDYFRLGREWFDSEESYLNYLSRSHKIDKRELQSLTEQKNLQEQEYQNNVEPFLRELKPFHIKSRNYPVNYPGGEKNFIHTDICVELDIYKVSPEIEHILRAPGSLFGWRYPYYPEDLSFFNNGYCWFSLISEDSYACMFIEDVNEVDFLVNKGVDLKTLECDIALEELFHEKY